MPFRAKNTLTSEHLSITAFTNPKLELHGMPLVCPFCATEFVVKGGAGRKVCAHFAHKHTCSANVERKPGESSQGESAPHMAAKKYLYDRLCVVNHDMITQGIGHYEFEVGVKRDGVWRIADIGEIHGETGDLITAYEIQLSRITLDQLQERTEAYAAVDVDVFWCLGGAANTPENRGWCLERTGICGVIRVEETALTESSALRSAL